jgi:hypothetical protein
MDRLKGEKPTVGVDSKVSEVFGEGNFLRSFLPTRVTFPPSSHDEIVGFVVHGGFNHKTSNTSTFNHSSSEPLQPLLLRPYHLVQYPPLLTRSH